MVTTNDPTIVSFNDMHVAWQLLAKVNPANPIAVAEAVPKMLAALEEIAFCCENNRADNGAIFVGDDIRANVNILLRKIHAKGGGE